MLLESLAGFVDAGAEVVLTVPGPGPLVGLAEDLGVEVLVRPVPVLRKSALSLRGGAALAGATVAAAVRGAALLRRLRPDVAYVSTLTTPSWIALARALRVPVVCHVHEAESTAAPAVQRVLTAPLLAATSVLVNSTFALEVLERSWPRLRGRSTVVLNGVAGPPTPAGARPRAAGPVHLLYVGRLSERKGVLVAVEALGRLLGAGLDVRLDLVGDVFAEHEDFGRRLRARLAEPALADRVALHGFSADVWGHLAACDVLLVPSVLPEPFGNTAVEGVLAGRPVVASATGGLPEAVGGFASVRLVAAGDAAALADAVRTLVGDLPAVSAAALSDAGAAATRYAPGRYRADVAGQVLAVARRAARPAVREPAPGRARSVTGSG
nr:glycosyltransferase [Kineococcus siccus]